MNTPVNTPTNVNAASGEIAYVAGGCFWCIESVLQTQPGVIAAINGYAGGDEATARYSIISQGTTKHREAVKVIFDPTVISYAEVIELYFRQIDPTDKYGQFADQGPQYTTAIYYTDEAQKMTAQSIIDAINTSKKFDKPVATKLEAFTTFFDAEEEHQDYFLKRSAHYNAYSKASGRKDYTHETRQESDDVFSGIDTSTGAKDLREMLDPLSYQVTQENMTEPPFNNKYRDHHETGIYVDIVDGTPLFSSLDKFDSGTGWPSFTRPIDEALVADKTDEAYGMVRTEIRSKRADSHLGHIFDDGPSDKGGKRYCINSAALKFVALAEMEKQGYGKYISLFDSGYVWTGTTDSNAGKIGADTVTMSYEQALSTYGSGGRYLDYDQTLMNSLTGQIVLFFHADRCPTCQAFEKTVLSKAIPSNLTILKVDFDTATELKKKYTILSQTSFVQVDAKGNMIKRWIGARDLGDVYEKLQ